MLKLNGFICACVLAMVCNVASAQIKIVIDNKEIPTEDIESIVILPNSNLISVATTRAYTVQASDVAPPAPGALAVTFSASPSTITEGGSTTLEWTTQNAASCTPTGGAAGWNQTSITIPSGSFSLTSSTPTTYNFTLTCQGNAGDSMVKTATVTVNAEPVTTACGTPALTNGVVKNWGDFWLIDFPKPGYDNRLLSVPKLSYTALKFNTGDVVDDGKISLLEFTGTTGIRRGNISECPGDFGTKFDNDRSTPDDPTNCSFQWGLGGGIRWATNGRSGACQLKPNTDYYINVTFTDGADRNSSTCVNTRTGAACRVNMQHSNP